MLWIIVMAEKFIVLKRCTLAQGITTPSLERLIFQDMHLIEEACLVDFNFPFKHFCS